MLIGHVYYKFIAECNSSHISNIHSIYLSTEMLVEYMVYDKLITVILDDKHTHYISQELDRLQHFYNGWLQARSFLTNRAGYRNKYISCGGIIQDN